MCRRGSEGLERLRLKKLGKDEGDTVIRSLLTKTDTCSLSSFPRTLLRQYPR